MDLFPPEIRILILKAAARSGRTSDVVTLRLVCKEFDAILRPILCRTLSLDISKLSMISCYTQPDPKFLQAISRYCDSLFVDLTVLRDELEVDAFERCMGWIGFFWGRGDIDDMRKRYCLNPMSFSGVDLRDRMDTILANCQQIERARLSLPLPIISRHSAPGRLVLANALAALASRPQEDAAKLRVLVLENVTIGSLWDLYYNPLDRQNLMTVFEGLDHLVLSIVRHATNPEARVALPTTLWTTIGMAKSLKTLCLVGLDSLSDPPESSLRLSQSGLTCDCISELDWQDTILPPPTVSYHHLACLELRRIDLDSDFFPAAAKSFGSTLRELHLNKVCLKIRLAPGASHRSKDRWVGFPKSYPGVDDEGVAHIVRKGFPALQVCRATRLSYDFHSVAEELERYHDLDLDLDDPCGLERSLDRRFVEVAMGHEQPKVKVDRPCDTLSHPTTDPVCAAQSPQRALEPGPKDMQPSDWDVTAYHELVANPTSHWLDGLDGYIPNDMSASTKVLGKFAAAACRRLSKHVERFQPHAPDAKFHVVYEGSLPLGVVMGRLTTQRMEQTAATADFYWLEQIPNRLRELDCNDEGDEPYDVGNHPAFRNWPANYPINDEEPWMLEDPDYDNYVYDDY